MRSGVSNTQTALAFAAAAAACVAALRAADADASADRRPTLSAQGPSAQSESWRKREECTVTYSLESSCTFHLGCGPSTEAATVAYCMQLLREALVNEPAGLRTSTRSPTLTRWASSEVGCTASKVITDLFVSRHGTSSNVT